MKSIALDDIDHASLRSLIGNRCLRKAGLTIFDSVGETYTITIGGTVKTGDVITTTINGTDVPFTITGSETTEDLVATAVAGAIEGSGIAGVVAATASLHVVSIVASPVSSAFTISVAVTGTGHTTTATLSETVIGATGVETANTIQYLIDGKLYTKAATTGVAIPGTTLVAPAATSSFRWYLTVINAAGTITAHAGTNDLNELPTIPDGTAPIGAFKVSVEAGHTFVPGVTGLGGDGITTTLYDLSCVPSAGIPS